MESTNKKSDFMKCLNFSYRTACLQCSLSDKDVSEYVQFLKRESLNLPKKYAIHRVGQQIDNTWVFSRNVHISSSGVRIPTENSSFVWIGDVFIGPGIASQKDECSISLPLSSDPLNHLLRKLQEVLKHNFMPCVLLMASGILCLQYETMLKKLNFCPIPIAFGVAGTGKTTALQSTMALMGALKNRLFSKITKAKMLQLCGASGIPLGVDDPESKTEVSRLVIDLYNGASSATVSHGIIKPTSTCIIASNFTTDDQQRYETYYFSMKAWPIIILMHA